MDSCGKQQYLSEPVLTIEHRLCLPHSIALNQCANVPFYRIRDTDTHQEHSVVYRLWLEIRFKNHLINTKTMTWDNFTSQNTPISQVSNQFYLLLSLFPWIPFFAITRSGQGTLGTDKQLVLVFALANKLEAESPAAWIQKAGRRTWFMIIDQSRDLRYNCYYTMSG